MHTVLIVALTSWCAGTSALDLSGPWQLDNPSKPEPYYATLLAPNTYTVNCSVTAKTACGWVQANISQSGTSLSVSFSNGAQDTGSVDSGFTYITWRDGSAWKRPPPKGQLTHVHFAPHSHMDPGWFQTVDDLYETLFKGVVEDVVASLAASPQRTFAAEHAVIFAMYYSTANASQQALMRAHVARGALEFTGGGWVQPDEAITRHEDLIDQLTLGRAFLTGTLGHAPLKTAWIADPFGHSTSSAAMHAAAYADLLLLGREMSPLDPISAQSGAVWHPTASLPNPGAFAPGSSILTQDYHVYCDPYRGMLDNLKKNDTSAAVQQLLSFVQGAASRPPYHSQLIVMFGDDAPSQAPFAQMYPAMDALLAAANALTPATNFSFSYSTPGRYVAALAASLAGQQGSGGGAFPPRAPWDMLPLVGNEFPYWVGYYTSRPELKQAVHASSALFRAASQLHALSGSAAWEEELGDLLPLWRSLGLAQHHDIITGDCWDLGAFYLLCFFFLSLPLSSSTSLGDALSILCSPRHPHAFTRIFHSHAQLHHARNTRAHTHTRSE
jgi:hypothetical protein